MKRMKHIYAVGETILDIIFKEGEPRTAKPGGSSFNAAVTLGRLGAPVTFISEMGNDRVGDMIQAFLDENDVDSRYVIKMDNQQFLLLFLTRRVMPSTSFTKITPISAWMLSSPSSRLMTS